MELKMQWPDRIGRRLKLRDMHVLLAVVESGSMARAAQQLSISQPVVSKAVADLEHTLGVRLLERDRHGVEVTPHGQALLESALAAFDELRRGVQKIEFLTDPTTGEVRIGVTEPIAMGLLPVVIDRLCRRYPRLSVDVVQAPTTAALHRELRERTVDFVVGRLALPSTESDMSVEVLFNEPILVVAGSRSDWAKRRRIEPSELANARWVLPRSGTPARALIADWFHACRLELPRTGVVCNSIQLQNALIATGQFLTLLPRSLLQFGARRPDIKVLNVRHPAPHGPVGILTLKNREPAPVTRLFMDCIRDAAKPLAQAKSTSGRRSTPK
jgi:DNA-binding transcriptional LysR family regulator